MSTTPSEFEIQAYVDGRLDDVRRQAVEFYLAQHPERAEEVRAWQRDAQQLRAALAGVPDLPENPALDPAHIRRRRERQARMRWAMAALWLLTLGVGGFGGWQAQSWRAARLEPPMGDALQAYRMFASDRATRLDVVRQRYDDMQRWLDDHFDGAPQLPELHAAGFRPVGARLLATAAGPAAMVFYTNQQGEVISFYLRRPSSRGLLPRGQRRDGNLIAAYGSDGGYDYAVVSHADAQSVRVMRAALSAMTTTS
jgi:anti-sigma factor RsiW